MSSILTNSGAMTALRVLRHVRDAQDDVQSMVGTGMAVATARDDAAVWAISKVMQSDAAAFDQINDALSLGAATVAVAGQASETVVDLIADMKAKVIAGAQENVDRAKLGADIDALRDQISQLVAAAQFNGLNLVDHTFPERGADTALLASLDRDARGVEARWISVAKQDLSLHEEEATGWNTTGIGRTIAAGDRRLLGRVQDTEAPGTLFRMNGLAGLPLPRPVVFGHGGDHAQTIRDIRDGMEFAAKALGLSFAFDYSTTATGTQIYATNTGDTAITLTDVDLEIVRFGTPTAQTRVPGRLSLLNHVSVADAGLARASLHIIERKLDHATAAAAEFGTVSNRIDTQRAFVSHLADALKSGIGALVDADLEEAQAQQQALQVQGELAGQALSIANAAPEHLLSLFE